MAATQLLRADMPYREAPSFLLKPGNDLMLLTAGERQCILSNVRLCIADLALPQEAVIYWNC